MNSNNADEKEAKTESSRKCDWLPTMPIQLQQQHQRKMQESTEQQLYFGLSRTVIIVSQRLQWKTE